MKFWLAVIATLGLAIALGVQVLFLNSWPFLAVPNLNKPQPQQTGAAKAPPALEPLASQIIDVCQTAEYKPVCYEKEIPRTMDSLSMEEAFNLTRLVQNLDQTYSYCHVLGHKLSAKETAKDPSKWKEVITRCPPGLCSNGCIHGAFQERFRTESLNDEEIEQYLPEFQDVCEPREGWNPTGLEQATCYHALGHLLMYITNADIQKSVNLCERIAARPDGQQDFSQLCLDGAFMQIFQPLENEDFALIEGKVPKKEAMQKFCAPFTGQTRQPCWSESWPLVRDQILQPKGLEEFCNAKILLTESDKNRCFTGMYYVVGAQLQLQDTKMREFCAGASTERQGQCYAQFASRLVETDYRNIPRAVEMCAAAVSRLAQDACFGEMLTVAVYDFQPGSKEQAELCSLLPKEWQERCGK